MNRKLSACLLLIVLFALSLPALTSCSGSGNEFSDFPCKFKGDKKWSLISTKGKVRAEDEMKHSPTPSTCGRFWLQNDQGYWELYDVDNPLRPVSDKEFRYVTYFYNDKALVAERNKPVTIIDRDGNTLQSLEKIGSAEPAEFSNIADGLAVWRVDTLQGVVNFDGETVIPPKYHYIDQPADGFILAHDRNAQAFYEENPEKVPESRITVFDYKGQKLFTLSSRKYGRVAEGFTGGYLPVAKVSDGKESWGLIDGTGEVAVSPSPKNRQITEVCGDNYIFADDDGKLGVRSIKENATMIKAKYSTARFLDRDHLAVSTSGTDDIDEQEYFIIDLKGERTINRRFKIISPMFNGHLFVSTGTNRWEIIDIDGEIAGDHPAIEDVMFYPWQPSTIVKSDFIDIQKLINGLGMTANGVDGLTFQSSVRQAIDRQLRYFSYTNKPVASGYSNTDEVNIFPTVEGELLTITVKFPSALSRQTFRSERVIDYVWGNYYWYHDNRIPTGYVFSSEHPSKFIVTFNNYGKLRGKLRQLYGELVKFFKKQGTVVDTNTGATLIDIGSGRTVLIALESNSVKVMWGNLNFSEKSIHPYNGNKEKLEEAFYGDFDEAGDASW